MAKKYRVKNWRCYNNSLVNRGNVTVWFSSEAIARWNSTVNTGKPGRPEKYSELAILTSLTIGKVFNLPLRQLEGFVQSYIYQMNLDLPCPDYTTLSKRKKSLSTKAPTIPTGSGSIDIVVDSTGLKVYGEGEWKVRQHGPEKRRKWIKLHLAGNPQTHMIKSAAVSPQNVADNQVLYDLLHHINDPIKAVYGDGGYDSHASFKLIADRGAIPVISPRYNAKIRDPISKNNPRDHVVRSIQSMGSKEWKTKSGYHKRSIAETFMSRLKTIFGGRLRSRTFENQVVETHIMCLSLNSMTKLGMPISVPVT